MIQNRTHFPGMEYIVGRRTTLRLHCPRDWWIGMPSRPFTPEGMLIWEIPGTSIVRVRVAGESLAGGCRARNGSAAPVHELEGFAGRQFAPEPQWREVNRLIEWPTLDTVTGVEVEIRSPEGKLITAADTPEVVCILYGSMVRA